MQAYVGNGRPIVGGIDYHLVAIMALVLSIVDFGLIMWVALKGGDAWVVAMRRIARLKRKQGTS